MKFNKGTPKPANSGRKKGVPNRATVSVKEALTLAFEGIGGVPALIDWAVNARNRGEFYKLYAKLLPTQITGENGKPVALCIVEQIVDADEAKEDRPAAPDSTGLPQV